jgi:hypothetical protein
MIQYFCSKVLAGCSRNTVSKLTATGIPPHIMLANEVTMLKAEMSQLRMHLLSKLDQLPEDLKSCMLENFQINGTVPITHAQVVTMMTDLQATILQALQSTRNTSLDTSLTNNNLERRALVGDGVIEGYNTWSWGGRIHFVPQDFRFPRKCNVRTLWDLWWRGKRFDNIAPYRRLNTYDLFEDSDKQFLSKAKTVMGFLGSFTRVTLATLRDGTDAERDGIFSNAYQQVFFALKPGRTLADFDRSRFGDLNYTSVYDMVKKVTH